MWNVTTVKNFLPLTPKASFNGIANPKGPDGAPLLCWEQSPELDRTEIYLYPIIANSITGELWTEANLYLFDKAFNIDLPALEPETILSKAKDLAEMRNILDGDGTDYVLDIVHKIYRPTYVLCERLGEKADLGRSKDACVRIIRNSIDMYEWMQENKLASFKYPLWREQNRTVRVEDNIGRIMYVVRRSFDLISDFRNSTISASEVIIANTQSLDDVIVDGGRLTPLEPNEQIMLMQSLRESNRYSIGLSFQFSLSTGARIESTFTVRKKHFERDDVSDDDFVYIAAGPITGIDTKYNKPQLLELSGFIYNKIKTYLTSPHYKCREAVAPHYGNERDQYVFLTDQGNPYYSSSDHRNLHNFDGGTIRKYISETLIPIMQSKGFNRTFTFHDLRATCGMNVVNANLHLIESGKMSRDGLLNLVMKKLNQNSVDVAVQYLGYKNRHKLESDTAQAWEAYLMSQWEDWQ
ncbi:hypothetical protein [Pseudomonas sp. NA-150]|uniref:hypothetical protein n=1 Tax=Pseudomonas sp. NA-150 TaxID=3367525 RepID=UPI0037C54992